MVGLFDIITERFPEIANEMLTQLVRKNMLAIEEFTEAQFVEALKQAIASGDFQRYVTRDSAQRVIYIPFQETTRLRTENQKLREALERIVSESTQYRINGYKWTVERALSTPKGKGR